MTQEKLISINHQLVQYYIDCLGERRDEPAYLLLHELGLSDRTIHGYALGYAPDDLRSFISFAEKNGITVLTDETETVAGKIDITGRLDYSFNSYAGERASSHELLKDRDKKRFQLVMDHQPKDLKVNAKEGADLQVSGHTHAGQLWPLGLLGPVLRFNEMTYGIEKIGDMNCIVTSGIAVWGAPFRTEKHSETVIINIEQSR